MKLINNARQWWRLWSVRLNALGLALMGWISFDPVGVLHVWNMMPRAVTQHVPPTVLTGLGAVLFALSIIARLVRQPKLEK